MKEAATSWRFEDSYRDFTARTAFFRSLLAGLPTEEPVVLAWMPAASVYFRDPDNNLLEFITMLTDPPRPDLGVLSWSEWVRRTPPAA